MLPIGADYLAIVWRAFIGAFSWFWALISADNYLMEVYFATIVIGWVMLLFVKPFFAGTWNHERWSRIRENRKERIANQNKESRRN